MLYHLSIEADDPGHVADVFAEIWGGVALPFPSVIDGSWVALAGDERGRLRGQHCLHAHVFRQRAGAGV